MQPKLRIATTVSIESLVGDYKLAKRKIEVLEKTIAAIRPALEQAAREAGGSLILGEHKITVSEGSRENFSLKDAKASLNSKILEPYITTSTFIVLRVT